MKYVCIDMSHYKLTHRTPSPGVVPQHLSVLLEDDYPVSQAAYTNFFSMLLPSASVVLSQSPLQTYDSCATRTFDLLIIDLKVPTLSTATIDLLSALTAKTSVVIISAVRQRELSIPTALARVSVIEKPLRIESLVSILRHRSYISGN